MLSSRLPPIVLGCLVASSLMFPAEDSSLSDPAPPTPETVREALLKAARFMRSIAVEGGYVWRVSTDLTERAGEETTTATQIWVQPPGTPAVGLSFLRAFATTGDDEYLQYARDAALALARGQLESGGWDYQIEFAPEERSRWKYRLAEGTAPSPGARNRTTFDDDNTQSALRFLLTFCDAAKQAPSAEDARIEQARDYGLRRLLDAQYPIGAWPQRWDGDPHDPQRYPVIAASYPDSYPAEQPDTGYHAHYTLNDNTHRDCIFTLLEASRRTGRAEYRNGARQATEFLLLAQMPEPQPAWAQQYDARMHPAWARAFEPPSITAGETAGIIHLLVDMHGEFGDKRYLEAARRAADWLRRSEIAPGRWARLYELRTNRPIYGDRDGRIHYTLAEISQERRAGYAWEGDFGIARALTRLERALSGRESTASPERFRPVRSDATVKDVLASLDERGRWVSHRRFASSQRGEWIQSAVFVRNMDTLCSWLERND